MASPVASHNPAGVFKGLGMLAGSAINTLGNWRDPNAQSYTSVPGLGNVDISASLQSGSVVRPASANTSSQVLGQQFSSTPIGPARPTTGTGGSYPVNTSITSPTPTPSPTGQPTPNPFDALKGEISSGYDQYFNNLNSLLGGLDGQRQGLEQIANNQYQQGFNTLTGQYNTGVNDLNATRRTTEANQAKNLKSLAESMRNQFLSGSVMLGAKGAGDSSAANQYAYALTKMGNQQRGDVVGQTAEIQNQINDREFKLKQTYDTETQNLALERDSKIGEIAQWFSDAQNSIRSQIADGSLRKAQDIANVSKDALNTALNMYQQTVSMFQNKQSALESWAMSNSQTINQLKQNMASVANYTPTLPAFQGMNGLPNVTSGNQTGLFSGFGGSQTDETNKPLFG